MEQLSLSMKETKELLAGRVKRQIKNPDIKLRSLFIAGERGIGKTELVHQVAREVGEELGINMRVVVLPAAVLEAPDINGLGYVTPENRTTFAAPEFLPNDGHGILFIDEVNRSNTDVQNGLLTLVQDRKIHGHKVGDGWTIVGAGNTNTNGGNYKIREFDPALKDRFSYVTLSPNPSDLITYLLNKYPKSPIVAFLQNHTEFVSYDTRSTNTPRAIEYAVRSTLDLPPDSEQFKRELRADLGILAAGEILQWIEEKFKTLTLEDILKDRSKTVKYLKDNMENAAVISSTNTILAEEIIRRFDSNTQEMDTENLTVDEERLYLFNKEERENIIEYINTLSGEHLFALLAAITPKSEWQFNTEMCFSRHFMFNLVTREHYWPQARYQILKETLKTQIPELQQDLDKIGRNNYYNFKK